MCIIDENFISLIEKANNSELKAIYIIADKDIKSILESNGKVKAIKLKRKYAGKERKFIEINNLLKDKAI